MDSMSDNQVWTLVEPPEGITPIGCKWVFKKKTDMYGNVQTYKGRLVAKGYRQIHGIDYDETFSPVAMFKSIRILLAIAAFHDYEIWQMDIKTAFLNGKLEEDVRRNLQPLDSRLHDELESLISTNSQKDLYVIHPIKLESKITETPFRSKRKIDKLLLWDLEVDAISSGDVVGANFDGY
ncbi:hypothetical protein V6N12_010158 [Hibiscus sabdariffa]|uniref:Reverse transcriptase Ty1/copia-type domain-containing protein n=1 Tax=Hibiscus sabdariffa TaxID=183260 RepID=A0ABR2EF43_9ROSI